jgi:cellulose synthase/poly-beta-1,6-N-acetylglucosamine synthase-like glycosyltransferase
LILPPFVSVILPFWGPNVTQVSECATAVMQQTLPHDRFELIVIDNHRTPLPELATALPPGCILLHEPQPGSYSARNRGLREARGEIVAFTDSDCLPAPDWLRTGVNALLDNPDLGFVGGEIELTWLGERPNIVEIYDLCLGLNQAEYIDRGRFCATANLFTRMSVLEKVGRFDDTVFSGGDRMWGERAVALGFRCSYMADAVVLHPARATMPDLLSRTRRVAAADFKRIRSSGTSGMRQFISRSRDEIALAAARLLRIAQRRREFGFLPTCGALGIASLVILVKGLECIRLMFGGRAHR